MSFLLIDNTTDLENAKMTPLIIDYFRLQNKDLIILSTKSKINELPNNCMGIILSGGPLLLSNETLLDEYILNLRVLIKFPKVPVLGICFGFQIISMAYGSNIGKLKIPKKNLFEKIKINKKDSILFQNIKDDYIEVFQYHNDYIRDIPEDFIITARDDNNIIQTIEE